MRARLFALIVSLTCVSTSVAQAPPWISSGTSANQKSSTPSSEELSPAQSTGQQSPFASPALAGMIPSSGDLFGSNQNCAPCEQKCCAPCGPPGDFWVGAEYLMWWTSGSRLPALITSAPPNTTNFGELGRPDTRVLYGNSTINNQLQSGFQVHGGFWLNDCHTCGIDISFFDLFTSRSTFNASSNGTNVALFRPFFNTSTGMQGSEDISYTPDGIAGGATVQNRSTFLGGEANFRKQLCCVDDCCKSYRVDLLLGYRILSLQESLEIDENLNTTAPAGNILVQDRFVTNNVFNGGQVGIDAECSRNGWIFGLRSLVALGVTTQSVNISGLTVLTPAGGTPTVLQGGLLAQKTNIGYYTRDPFTVVPEVCLKVGRQITENFRLTIGYDFLYWSNVLHAANQVDPVVNPYYIPTTGTPAGSPLPYRPEFTYHTSGFFAHGVTFGAEFRY